MTNLAINPAGCTITVPFHGSELFVVNHNGEPYTPMKPIVEGMGMVWAAQFVKLKQSFVSTVSEIEMVAEDGRLRKMLCLPLRKLAGWLRTISPNKVRPEIRERVIQYQEECDDVLYEYWTKGQVTNPRKFKETKAKTTSDERTPLRDAVNMLVSKKHLLYPDAYAMIHQQFKVDSIEDLTLEQLPLAVEYVHRLVLEGEYLPKDPIFTPVPQVAPARQPSRIMLYLDERGSVISSIPLREDQIALTLNDFVELAKRNGMMVLTKQELAAKVTHLLA
jgi:hypothetical protein